MLHTVKLIVSATFTKRFSMAKRPVGRILALVVLIALGLGLYFWLAERTPVIVQPAETESTP